MEKTIDQLFENKTTSLWKNKQRVLVLSSRGPTQRHRHLMMDFINLLPHSKKEVIFIYVKAKIEKKDVPVQINELCQIHSAQNFLLFETRKKRDLYLWMGRVPGGPSVKFRVENIHLTDELKMSGNCLKGSRPILSFDASFDANTHLKLIKEIAISTFNVPQFHPKSQPFIDHIFQFSYADNRIWFRNFQVIKFYPQIAKVVNGNQESMELHEIGPRLVLNPICILDSCMNGTQLYQNPQYISSQQIVMNNKRKLATEEKQKIKKKIKRDKRMSELQIQDDGIYNDQLFDF